jgi:trehalose synthase
MVELLDAAPLLDLSRSDAHLMLVGPDVEGVDDDPEGSEVFATCESRWSALPDDVRSRVHLACLPMDDPDENAAMVNALQRHAAVVVQNSRAEGFGLTVTEAMWKARPVVATAVGGICDQIVDGVHGRLVSPGDPNALAGAITELLGDQVTAERLGDEARRRVADAFLDDRHLIARAELYRWCVEGGV